MENLIPPSWQSLWTPIFSGLLETTNLLTGCTGNTEWHILRGITSGHGRLTIYLNTFTAGALGLQLTLRTLSLSWPMSLRDLIRPDTWLQTSRLTLGSPPFLEQEAPSISNQASTGSRRHRRKLTVLLLRSRRSIST